MLTCESVATRVAKDPRLGDRASLAILSLSSVFRLGPETREALAEALASRVPAGVPGTSEQSEKLLEATTLSQVCRPHSSQAVYSDTLGLMETCSGEVAVTGVAEKRKQYFQEKSVSQALRTNPGEVVDGDTCDQFERCFSASALKWLADREAEMLAVDLPNTRLAWSDFSELLREDSSGEWTMTLRKKAYRLMWKSWFYMPSEAMSRLRRAIELPEIETALEEIEQMVRCPGEQEKDAQSPANVELIGKQEKYAQSPAYVERILAHALKMTRSANRTADELRCVISAFIFLRSALYTAHITPLLSEYLSADFSIIPSTFTSASGQETSYSELIEKTREAVARSHAKNVERALQLKEIVERNESTNKITEPHLSALKRSLERNFMPKDGIAPRRKNKAAYLPLRVVLEEARELTDSTV